MILVKTTKEGVVTEVMNSDNYVDIVNHLEYLIEELEKNRIFHIETKTFKDSLARIDALATIENGWECGFMLGDGWLHGKVSHKKPDKE